MWSLGFVALLWQKTEVYVYVCVSTTEPTE